MNHLNQRTVKSKVSCTGIGLHSGTPITLSLCPAHTGTGIVFVRTDLPQHVEIPARAEYVVDTQMATTIGKDGVRVATIEHLMAALAGLGIDNCRVEVDGPEVPIMDGSAAPFVYLIRSAGIELQRAMKRFLVIRKPVTVKEGDKQATFLPASQFSVSFTIDFDHPLISNQSFRMDFSDRFFDREICRARTFGFYREVEMLKKMGLAKGGSIENAIVVDDFSILNPDGLRFPDEFVRHKILDSIGDVSLLGMPVIGHLVAHKSGHMLNHKLVTQVLGDPSTHDVLEVGEQKELERLDIRLPAWGGLEQVA
ncbi:UDP-3-O-acyl-N-acetylglucosamine deacetylase [Vulgatibacter incomptus]|uniref:UDP-3-O-acyl-N-acetylglucosamine deacetylase n=1 Tax=Vulgatibacter incomptus TaxID=1391653 RepID=A0A0K1PD69_9BACT|nr:UDP-3-O-acyl-N-acetylglucosamine deacetylase [Vulgatibacter incomptus]AKU91346.1 UDP-3-O-[3-hydroxymyristoyl] N-acetylglucosamine deacetylase [Vulgatibacter incomptus]